MTINGRTAQKAVLTAGYTALAGSLVLAIQMPQSGYRLSIYGSMPNAFWVGVAVALIAAVAVVGHAADTGPSRVRDAGAGLATLGAVSVVALPVLRSYHYYGAGDSLSHLGWAREMRRGLIQPVEIVYPGVHLLSIQFGELAGLSSRRAMQLFVLVALPLIFVVSFVACAYYLTGRRRTAAVGVIVAAMFVPINNVSVHPVVHPSSQAILLLPVVLLALLLFLGSSDERFPLVTPAGTLLLFVSVAYVFIHPQEAMTYLSMLGGIAILQFLVRRYRNEHPIASFRPVYAHTIVVGMIFLGWTRLHSRARGRFEAVIESLLSNPEVLSQTSSRGASLVDLGGSLLELYLKLFSVTTVLMLLAGGLILALLLGRLDPSARRRNAFIGVLSAALVFPTLGFLVIFVAQQGDHYFRFHGFIMVTVSLLGTLGIVAVGDRLSLADGRFRGVLSRRRVWSVLSVVFVVLLALQLVVVHPSPYIYQANGQVTETVMDGYEVSFRYADSETPFTGIRSGPSRYVDAIYGTHTAETMDFPGYESAVPERVFNSNVTSHYENDRYLVVTPKDRKQEVELYDGFRYRSAGFEALETEPGANRIQDNGGFTLYRLRGTDD